MKSLVRKIYIKTLRKWVRSSLGQQRLKLFLWDIYGYRVLLGIPGLSFREKVSILRRFIRVDLGLHHGHKPQEISHICREIARRAGRGGEVMVEAGCYNGGSTAKFSIFCKRFNYPLHVYDSFEGVEAAGAGQQSGYDYAGEYAASQAAVMQNVKKYGELDVCTFHKGWFEHTMKGYNMPTRIVYVDCDLAKGTNEVIQATAPYLSPDAVIFTQDYHIKPVRKLIEDPETWKPAGAQMPKIEFKSNSTAAIYWP